MWWWSIAAFAGKRALHGAVGLAAMPPGGVIVESSDPWGVEPAGDAVDADGTLVMQQVQAAAYQCFFDDFAPNLLDGSANGWFVAVDVALGVDGGLGPALVDGIALDGEFPCLAEAVDAIGSIRPLGMTLLISAPARLLVAGDARVRLAGDRDAGNNPEVHRALRFEARAAQVAAACIRRVGAIPTGTYPGDGASLIGAPDEFTACWAELSPTLAPWSGGGARFTLSYVAP